MYLRRPFPKGNTSPGKMKSVKVVIHNTNFINSKRQDSSEDYDSASDTETESDAIEKKKKKKKKKSLRSPKRKVMMESSI
ncbi:unnamed protein product [Lactuca virosa]|uniref:Uncharacterized protein n=1 Tax=Lactuca virosa TaxID=75947 RepID=A0AAU9N4H6_9ASTR|nr:unnamed protein product [Lactuca virosa]